MNCSVRYQWRVDNPLISSKSVLIMNVIVIDCERRYVGIIDRDFDSASIIRYVV